MTIQTNGDDCRESGAGEAMREQFEAWASDNGQFPRAIERSGDGYRFLPTQNKWDVWQASRATIEIEIPTTMHDEGSDYWFDDTFQPMRYERDIEREIKRHGLKVKQNEQRNPPQT